MVSCATTSEHKSVAANKVRVSMIKEKIGKYKKKKDINSGSYQGKFHPTIAPEVCYGNISYDKITVGIL